MGCHQRRTAQRGREHPQRRTLQRDAEQPDRGAHQLRYRRGAAGIPAGKNISFDALGNAVSVNNAFFSVCAPGGCYTCPSGTAEFAGTGLQGGVGGGSDWLTTTAPVVPGETLTMEFVIFDVGDALWDSSVLLDDFQWSVTPAGVGTG